MSSDTHALRADKARTIPFYRTIPALARNPLKAFEEVGRQADGAVVRLDLGPFRPYLISSPEHMQHVFRDNPDNYVREGMLWRPLRRMFGEGLGSDGPAWAHRRRLIQPMFSAKNVDAVLDELTRVIAEAVDALDPYARGAVPIDVRVEMTRIIHRALIRVFFGDGISTDDADRLGQAITGAFTSLGARLLLPFVPESFPLPGDSSFLRSTRMADDVVYPLIRRCREANGSTMDGRRDMVSLLCQQRDENGDPMDDQRVRNDMVSMFAGASETSAVTLTWLWVALDAHPQIADRVYDEIDRVVGAGPLVPAHLGDLTYTKMVLQELLRLYPVGWIIPRMARESDVVDGALIPGGSTVLLSPYLAHRMQRLWERPAVFDPERFSPERSQRRHRFAYLPFGGGAHQCLGSHFFIVEAQLIVAALLHRYRPVLVGSAPITAQPAATLRPRQRVEVVLRYRVPQ
jgi:cytochrome P450